MNKLPDLLEQAETKMQENGIQVLWTIDNAEANQHLLDIAQQHNVRSVVKSKSMVTEEIGLNHVMEEHGIEVVETDLGEYILQLNDEPPSHIVTPVIHKRKNSIRTIFIDKIEMLHTDDAKEMAQYARGNLPRGQRRQCADGHQPASSARCSGWLASRSLWKPLKIMPH